MPHSSSQAESSPIYCTHHMLLFSTREGLLLTKYELLLDSAENEDVTVEETTHFSGTRIKGLYCDRHIAINKDIETETEKACVLAEELGHYITSSGDILDQSDVMNRKQEQHARAWAYRKTIGLSDLISAYKYGCRNQYELAEYLNVTESFLSDALMHYKSEYGLCAKIDNYIIYFDPLGVLELKV